MSLIAAVAVLFIVFVSCIYWGEIVELAIRKLAFGRARFFTDKLIQHTLPGTLLDVGTGAGHIAALLSRAGMRVFAVDVRAHVLYVGMWLIGAPCARRLAEKDNIELATYDGEHLPHASNNFDNVTILFVLHHAADETSVLKEALRVLRVGGRLIVLEDTPEDARQRQTNAISDALLNAEVHSEGRNHSKEEWRAIFDNLGAVRLVHETSFDSSMFGFLRFYHTMFVLQKVEE